MTSTMLRTRWFLPLFSAALGGAFLIAFWLGGNPGDGLYSLAVMVIFGALIFAGGRSETIRGLRGDGRDERFAHLDLVATAISGSVLIGLVIAMCLWEWGHGRGRHPVRPARGDRRARLPHRHRRSPLARLRSRAVGRARRAWPFGCSDRCDDDCRRVVRLQERREAGRFGVRSRRGRHGKAEGGAPPAGRRLCARIPSGSRRRARDLGRVGRPDRERLRMSNRRIVRDRRARGAHCRTRGETAPAQRGPGRPARRPRHPKACALLDPSTA